jgi:hypothetical protein
MSKRIRVTGPGIYGAPTKDNPTGELPVGFEFDIGGDMPPGWVGRAVVVGAEPEEGSVLIGNADDDDRITAAREEVRAEAQKFIDGLRDQHAADMRDATEAFKALMERAEAAEKRVAELEAEAAARGPDPDLIRAAIDGLDPKNDAHWTKAGLPEVAAVKEALGADVNRAQIEAAASDAKRPEAE